jgi:hypothetical protein
MRDKTAEMIAFALFGKLLKTQKIKRYTRAEFNALRCNIRIKI